MKPENTGIETVKGLDKIPKIPERLSMPNRGSVRRKKSKAKWIIGAVVVLPAALGLVRHLHEAPAMEFATVSQERAGGISASFLRAGGFVNYDRIVDVGTTEKGPIEKLLFVEGQHFKKGQTLAILDNRELIVEKRIRDNQVNESRQTFNRNQKVFRAGALSQADYEKSVNDLQQAELARDLVAARLEKTIIKAPFDGVAIERYVEIGGLVEGRIVRFGEDGILVVEVDVNQNDIQKIAPKQPAIITLDAFPEMEYAGEVLKITPRGDKAKNTVPVKVRILRPDEHFRTNLSSKVYFVKDAVAGNEAVKSTLIMPEAAIFQEGDAQFVWKKEDDKFKKAAITIGKVFESGVSVTSGVEPEQEVLLNPGLFTITEGMPITAKQPFNIFDLIHH